MLLGCKYIDLKLRDCINSPFSSSPFSRAEFMTEIFEPLTKKESWDGLTFDKIALLFLVISIGALFDFNTEERHALAYRFYKTGSGTLGMSEFMESPSVVAVQALVNIILPSGLCNSSLLF